MNNVVPKIYKENYQVILRTSTQTSISGKMTVLSAASPLKNGFISYTLQAEQGRSEGKNT